MTTTKALDPVVLKALEDLRAAIEKLGGGRSRQPLDEQIKEKLAAQIAELSQIIERVTAAQQLAKRESAFRASPDGMYVRDNAGTYISKEEAERAVETIERVEKKTKEERSAA